MTAMPTSRPFQTDILDPHLADMMDRIKRTRFPDDSGNDDWRYGDNTDCHRELINCWINDDDWRDVERRMNELPQFNIDLMGVPLHCIHVRGKGKNPMPNRFAVVGVPTAVSIFPGEICKPPLAWTCKYFNLQQDRVHKDGGHFAPLEVPDLFVDDVRSFFATLRG